MEENCRAEKFRIMRSLKSPKLLITFLLLHQIAAVNTAYSQDQDRMQTIFTEDAKFGYLFSPGFKLNSVFNTLTTEANAYGGLLINEQIMLGFAGGINLGSDAVDYRYIGVISQYIYKPENFVHSSWQISLCYGSLDVYDNNTPGVGPILENDFFLMEPGFNVELNLMRTFRLVTGVSYRFVSSPPAQSSGDTVFNNRDLRGLNLRIGLVFGRLIEVLK